MERRKGGAAVSDGNGLMFSRKVEYSKETRDLLHRMMKESRLTNLQQRQIGYRVKNGQGLPTVVTTKDTHQHHRMSRSHGGSILRPRAGDGSPLGKAGLRSKDTIRKMNEMEDDSASSAGILISSPKYNSSVEKERLHNIMAFGKDKVPNEDKKAAASINSGGLEDNNDECSNSQRFDEVVKEIEERREFLKDMAKLGMQDKYRAQIETEISQRIRELELLNK